MNLGRPLINYNQYTSPSFDFQENDLSRYTLQEILESTPLTSHFKYNAQQSTSILLTKKQMLLRLIDYALVPELIQQQEKKKIKSDYPHICIDILVSLTEQFYNQIFISQSSINNQLEENKNQCPKLLIMDHIFKILDTDKTINETAAGYLQKIINSIIYRKQLQLFKYVWHNQSITRRLFQHCYSKSITNIILKILILCIENQEILNEKLIFMKKFINSLSEGNNLINEKLQNFLVIIEELIDKSQQRYDGPKFIPLLTNLISQQTFHIFQAIILNYFSNNYILIDCLQILNKILKFYISEKSKHDTRHQNKYNHYQEQEEEIKIHLMQTKFKEVLLEIALKIEIKVTEKTNQVAESSTLNLRVLLFYLNLLSLEPTYFNKLISIEFVSKLLQIMKRHTFNNILHNIQKSILMIGLTDSANLFLYSKQCPLIQFIIVELLTKEKYEAGYKSQLFHLVNTIENAKKNNEQIRQALSEYSEWNNLIQNFFKDRKKTHKRLLGGEDPNVRNENILQEDDEKIIEFNFNDEMKEKIIGGKEDGVVTNAEEEENFDQISLDIQSDDDKKKEEIKHQEQDQVRVEEIEKQKQETEIKKQQQPNNQKQQKLQQKEEKNLQLATKNVIKPEIENLQLVTKNVIKPEIENSAQTNINENLKQGVLDQFETHKYWQPQPNYKLSQLMNEVKQQQG